MSTRPRQTSLKTSQKQQSDDYARIVSRTLLSPVTFWQVCGSAPGVLAESAFFSLPALQQFFSISGSDSSHSSERPLATY